MYNKPSDGGGVCYSSFVFTFLLSWLKIRNKQQRQTYWQTYWNIIEQIFADRSQSVIRCDSQHCFHVGHDLTLFCISLFVNCSYNVIIQGKGFPDVNTRMMVRCLWSTLQIPILALVDADPHGNLSPFAFFTLDGDVAMSPPKYNYNKASRAAQSKSVYVSELKISIVHADSVSKSLRQKSRRIWCTIPPAML